MSDYLRRMHAHNFEYHTTGKNCWKRAMEPESEVQDYHGINKFLKLTAEEREDVPSRKNGVAEFFPWF